MRTAMQNVLQNPAPEFASVIRDHFALKKEHILLQIAAWSDELCAQKKSNRVTHDLPLVWPP
jgi:hypothetical protein